MKKNVLKKTIIAGSLSAVLAAGMLIPGAGLASAHSLSTQKGQSYSKYIQQWLQQNGYIGGTVQKPQSGSGNNNSNSGTGNNSTSQDQSSSSVVSAYAKEVVSLVNKERAKAGLKPLVIHTNLTKMAVAKAQDMNDNNYFSHTSPTYGSPFDMMKKFGITYKYAGENIAKGQKTPEEVVKAWMNSPGHKANIMNKNFTLIGVGYVNGYWVQAFVGK